MTQTVQDDIAHRYKTMSRERDVAKAKVIQYNEEIAALQQECTHPIGITTYDVKVCPDCGHIEKMAATHDVS